MKKIYPLFPEHNMRIELFFGGGGSYFNLPKAKYNIINDFDDDVTNLYLVIKNNRSEFIRQIKLLPISESLIKYWKKNFEVDSVMKAVRFVFLSNFTYLGKGDTLRIGLDNAKQTLIKNIDAVFYQLENTKILNKDFREVLPSISFTKGLNDKEKAFVYLDPVYHDTECNYTVPKWNSTDALDCFEIMVNSGIRCAMSEFNHPFVIDAAKERNLNIITIGERSNIKNRKVEILITNYEKNQLQLTL